MSQTSLWFGHLEIGDKSSPVVRDHKLNTGKADTIYLFNLVRNEIIEYKRDIVEPKLRELGKGDASVSKELKKAFTKAIKDFTPRGKTLNIPETAVVKPASAKKQADDDLPDIDIDDDSDDMFDDDEDDDN